MFTTWGRWAALLERNNWSCCPCVDFCGSSIVVSRREVNFSLISNTEGNQDDCCKWQWDEINEGSLFPCIWVGVLSHLIFLFCLFLREPRMLMHLVLEILLWLQSWILKCCCMVIALNEHQLLVCCSPAVLCFSALCYLAQWWVILNTALSVFVLLTFVYILQHVPNCLWLNIGQTARLRFIDTKEAGRREWLAGHLCLLAADSDVIDDVHVSVSWPWCSQRLLSKNTGKGLMPGSTALFSLRVTQ